jgi:hypothetical protein
VTNFSAIKDFRLKEQFGLQFRSEFFNLFNHTNFGCNGSTSSDSGGCSDPNNTASSSIFGQIRTAGPARIVQFASKLMW